MLNTFIHEYALESIFFDDIRQHIELHYFEPGEMILREDEKKPEYFYILVKGKARVSPSSEEGKFVLLDFIQPPDLLGDIEYMYEENNYHNVIALTDTIFIGYLCLLSINI